MGYAKKKLEFLNTISCISTMARSKLPKKENGLDILNDLDVCLVVIVKIAPVMIVEESTPQGREARCIYKTRNEET